MCLQLYIFTFCFHYRCASARLLVHPAGLALCICTCIYVIMFLHAVTFEWSSIINESLHFFCKGHSEKPLFCLYAQDDYLDSVLKCALAVITACSELRKVLFLAVSVTFRLYMKYLRNRWADFLVGGTHQIHREDVLGPSLRWVWRSISAACMWFVCGKNILL